MSNKSKGGKIVRLDRNRAAGPWEPLRPMLVTGEAKDSGVLAAFANNRFRVFIKSTVAAGLMMAGPTGQPQPVPVTHMIIAGPRPPSYSEVQRIKSELLHEESDACEIFPARHREIESDQTHIWCLPPGYRIPLGLMPTPIAPDMDAEVMPGSSIKRRDLLFYVVDTPGENPEDAPLREVFASEEDARETYEKAGSQFPEGRGSLEMIGNVPMEEEGAAWSPGAQERREQITSRIAEVGRKMAEEQKPMLDEARLPYGPYSIEDEMAEADGYADGWLEMEEASKMEELMEAGISKRNRDRQEAMAKEEAAAEEKAAADLARMREEMRHQKKRSGGRTH